MWRYRPFLPLTPDEVPVSLGEGMTPLLAIPRAGADLGVTDLWIKDEGVNPTGSFKARGLAAA
ncbi:MAG: pyridoxal-phosphate dependent enzyme, partial [Gemmatimonadales bacterium]